MLARGWFGASGRQALGPRPIFHFSQAASLPTGRPSKNHCGDRTAVTSLRLPAGAPGLCRRVYLPVATTPDQRKQLLQTTDSRNAPDRQLSLGIMSRKQTNADQQAPYTETKCQRDLNANCRAALKTFRSPLSYPLLPASRPCAQLKDRC